MNRIQRNQNGMAAIITTLVIMLLVTLIVSSFALIVRREQRQSLDRQLATQALYAAETGVADAKNAIERGAVAGNIDNCDTFTNDSEAVIDGNISYSCVLIDLDPTVPTYNEVDTNGSVLVPINPSGNLSSLTISWENSDGSTTFPSGGVGNLPQRPSTLPTALVRATLLPGFNPGVQLTRDSLRANAYTSFLYPNNAGPGTSTNTGFDAGNSGEFVTGSCNVGNRSANSNACSVTITGIPPGNHFLHLKPLYQKTSFKISGTVPSGDATFRGAQAVIDVTGRAADVLRRIRVAVPVNEGSRTRNFSNLMPEGALETTEEICKLFERTLTEVTNNCTSTPGTTVITPAGSPQCSGRSFNGTAVINSIFGGSIKLRYLPYEPNPNIDMTEEMIVSPILPGDCTYDVFVVYGDLANPYHEQQCNLNPSDFNQCGAAAQDEEEFYIEGIDSSSGSDVVVFTLPGPGQTPFPDLDSSEPTRDRTIRVSVPAGAQIDKVRFIHPPIQNLLPNGPFNDAVNLQSVRIYQFTINAVS